MGWRFDGLAALVFIAAGEAADLVVLAGNRAKNIGDGDRVEAVFKDGVGYDPAKLMRPVASLLLPFCSLAVSWESACRWPAGR